MVAVVSSAGLGLFGSSVSALGGIGASGNGAVGRGNDRVYVNTANGNLIIQSQDEHLSSLGLDLNLVRTYNSQGLLDDDNGDNWRLSLHQRVYNLTGNANTAGSAVTKVFGDGREVIYRYDVARQRYISTEGDGAHDTLTYSVGGWTWMDGSSRSTEIYNSAGLLTSSADTDGNAVSYEYVGSLLTEIEDSSGQRTYLDYTSNNLTQIRVVSNGVTQTLTRYEYDTSNRLSRVRVDLSPQDNAVSDGNIYETTYTYDGGSHRVASVTQSDGSSVVFTYELIDGVYRVASYSEGGTPASVAANTAMLTATQPVVTTQTYNINSSAVTSPGWQGAADIAEEPDTFYEGFGSVAFNAAGDGMALWGMGTNGGEPRAYVRYYTKVTDSWSAPIFVPGLMAGELAIDDDGNALVAWSTSIGGGTWSMYACQYDALTQSWSSPAMVSTQLGSDIGITGYNVALNNGRAVVSWGFRQPPQNTSLYAATMVNGVWGAPTLIENTSRGVSNSDLEMDSDGNATVVWYEAREGSTAGGGVWVNRWSASTGTWSGPTLLGSAGQTVVDIRLAFDGAGNGFVVWRLLDAIVVRRYDATIGWESEQSFATPYGASMALDADAQGNAILAWVENGVLKTRRYDALSSTWGSIQAIAGSVNALDFESYYLTIRAAIDGDKAMVLWTQPGTGPGQKLYAARLTAGIWGAAEHVGPSTMYSATERAAGMTAGGDIFVVFRHHSSSTYYDVFTNRFVSSYRYTIPAGATWASIAQAVYGTSSAAAADQLRDLLGNPALVAGNVLRDLPVQLSVTSTTQVPVTPYYNVQPGDTWVSIAQTIYGTGDGAAAAALRSALGDPTLTAGAHLEVPLTLSFTSLGRVTTLTYSSPIAGSGSQTRTANNGVLSNTDVQTSTQSYGVNAGALISTRTDTTTTNYTLNNGVLTIPPGAGGWSPAELLESGTAHASSPQVAFDAFGNGLVVWAQASDIIVRRYDAATNTWGASTTLDARTETAAVPQLAIDYTTGNAVIAWVQSDGVAQSIHARVFNASSSAWGTTQLLESGTGAVSALPTDLGVAMAGGYAAVAWTQHDGTENSIFVSRFSSGSWSSATAVDNSSAEAEQAKVAMDSSGNVSVVWRQHSATDDPHIYYSRFSASTQSFSTPLFLDGWDDGDRFPDIVFDAQGNGFLVFGNGPFVSRFDAATATWGPMQYMDSEQDSGLGWGWDIAIDAAGNAILGWVSGYDGDSEVRVRRYDVTTGVWSSATTLENSTGPLDPDGNVSVGINGVHAVAAWVQAEGSSSNLYAARLDNGTWGARQLMESRDEPSAQAQIAIDPSGNAVIVWRQADGFARSIYQSRYTQGNGTPYYTVPSGPTWQSLANTLYGVNSAAAGSALQAALGSPTLTAGLQLTNLPPVLSITTTTVTQVTPYFVIPSGATWQSIANTLYGIDSAAAGSALQAAMGNPPLTAGEHLTDPPQTLTVTTTTTVIVAPYYTVQAGDTWAEITQTVYGTNDAQAVAALRAALGDPSLTTGTRLTVPQTLMFGSGGSIAGYLRTDVADAAGRVTSYFQNAAGRLTSVLAPEMAGARIETRYDYDADGNVISIVEDPSGLNRVRTLEYDEHGNLLLTRDSAGVTVTRTYDADNQLVTETSYLQADPDGAGGATASQPLTTRYIYDSEQHLRFVVSAAGRVTEHRYDAEGRRTATLSYSSGVYDVTSLSVTTALSEAQLVAWALLQDRTKLQRTDFDYDFRGLLSSSTSYERTDGAGSGIAQGAATTRYIYDQRGWLLQTIDPRGSASNASDPSTPYATTMTYDGLGRVLTATQWIANGTLRTAVTQFDDAGNRIVTTSPDGLVTTAVFDRMGQLLTTRLSGDSLTGISTTSYTYDATGNLRIVTDPTGVRQHSLYDPNGRKVADIDGNGTLTEYVYNDANEMVKTIKYADALTVASLASLVDSSGNPTDVSLATLRAALPTTIGRASDQILRNVFDAAGRLVYTIDAGWAVTRRHYDGANRITGVVEYAQRVTIAGSQGELSEAVLSPLLDQNDPNNRWLRSFYDNDGKLVGTLDGEGYLVESLRDAAGRVQRQVEYANQTDSALWRTGTLDQLRPATDTETEIDFEQDVVSYFFYDGQGRQIGVLDGEGYLTEAVYTSAGHVDRTIRYGRHNATGTDLGALVHQTGDTLESLRSRVPAGALSQTTSYTYDGAGQVITRTTYDGTVTAYGYDEAGRQNSVTVAQGTLDARTSQVKYDLLGRVIRELSAEGALALQALGASPTPALITQVWDRYGISYEYDLAGRRVSATTTPYDATTGAQTSTTYYYYNDDGQLRFTVNALGERVELRYNALGQLTEQIAYTNRISTAGLHGGLLDATTLTQLTASPNPAKDAKTAFTYTLRGEVASRVTAEGSSITNVYDAFGQLHSRTTISETSNELQRYTYDRRGSLQQTQTDPNGVNATEMRAYDAFGRLISVRDARENITRIRYDRLGREIAIVDALNGERLATYDAFSRVLTTRDALLNVTRYSYDVLDEQNNTRNVVVTMPEGLSFTTYRNAHGETVLVKDPRGVLTATEYDKNGNVVRTIQGGVEQSRNVYDTAGRLLSTRDANGNLTRLSYDAVNRVFTRTLQGSSANSELVLTTTYAYDGQGRVIDVTDPSGSVTRTEYDRDGRVTDLYTDYGTGRLNLRTHYEYDVVNRTVTVTEGYGATGVHFSPRVTRISYDQLGRRIAETIDPGSGVNPATGEIYLNLTIRYEYDENDNLIRKQDASGRYTWYVYDELNRLRFVVDPPNDTLGSALFGLSGVTETRYDAENRITSTRHYATAVTGPGSTVRELPLATIAGQVGTGTAQDRVVIFIYDRDGRQTYQIDAGGTLTYLEYDGSGNVVRRTQYADKAASGSYYTGATYSAATGTHTLYVGASAVDTITADGTRDRATSALYDSFNRAIFTIDAVGDVVAYKYDGNGNLVSTTAYATQDTAVTVATVADWVLTHTNADDRTTRYWYDGAGRLRFTLDAEGYLTEQRYDDSTRERTDIVYAVKPTIAANATLTQVVTAAGVIDNNLEDQLTLTRRDAAGRVTSVRDALGNTEYFGYDAVGNKLWFTNKKGSAAQDANYTWRYEYDANHRLVKETAPPVAVATVTTEGTGLHASTVANVALETVMTYDALGNVRTRTEAANTTRSRTTTYEYDSMGRQIITRYPPAEIYNYSNDTVVTDGSLYSEVGYDALGNAIYGRDVAGNYTHKGYDALGRLTWEVDAQRYLTFNIYDAFGNVTETRRFAAAIDSNVGSAGRPVIGYPSSPAVGANDRVLTREFDKLNRVSKVIEPAGFVFDSSLVSGTQSGEATPQTVFKYDAFGQVVRESRLVHGIGLGTSPPSPDASPSIWASSYYYYDRRGLKIAEVDAERYLTRYEYDETGDVKTKTEYAGRLSSVSIGTLPVAPPTTPTSGSNRYTRYSYDVLNRLLSETLDINYYDFSNPMLESYRTGSTSVSYGYDAVGNRITSTVNNATTYSYYDALGRVVAIAEPRRLVAQAQGTSLTPYTEMFRDAYGNVVKQIEYAGDVGAASTSVKPTVSAGLANDSRNRVTLNRFDLHGRLVETAMAAQVVGQAVDSNNASYAVRHVAYTKRGEIAKQWQTIQTVNPDTTSGAPAYISETISSTQYYDALGRQIRIVEPQAAGRVRDAWTDYSAFGEVTERRMMNANGVGVFGRETFEYDRNGRLWRTNADTGAYRVYLYDLAGRATAEIKSKDLDLHASANLQAVLSLPGTNLMRSESVYDWLGRVVEQRGPSFELLDNTWTVIGTAVTNVFQSVDRWGNVTRIVDDQGRTTDYYYDQRNKLIKTILPTVDVLSTRGTFDDPSVALPRFRPVAYNYYDRDGNLIGKNILESRNVDPAGVAGVKPVEQAIYNEVGQVIKEKGLATANNNAERLYTLDRWGQRVQSVDELGYRTRYQYDQVGNLTGLARERGAGEFDSTGLYQPTDFPTVQRPPAMQGPSSGHEVIKYAYDQAGRRISETTGEFTGSSGNEQETIRYWYDLFGNLIRKREPLGVVSVTASDGSQIEVRYETTYEYDMNGRKIREVDGNGSWMTWSYDYFGLVQQHQQLTNSNGWVASSAYGATGDTITYTYNRAGLLDFQSSTFGQSIDYQYDGAGHLRRIVDNGTQHGTGQGILYGIDRDTDYRYNSLGERVGERTVIDGLTHQNATIVFDELGRLKSVTDVRSSVEYFYDARGNRTRVLETYLDNTSQSRTHEDWYVYDELNRVVISQGVLWQSFAIKEIRINETQGVELTYDARGNRSTSITYGKRLVQSTTMDEWGQTHTTYSEVNGYDEHRYHYDGLSRLIWDWRSMDTYDEFGNFVEGSIDDPFSPGIVADERYYDHASRQITQIAKSLGSSGALDTRTTNSTYDDNGRLSLQSTGLNGWMESEIHYGTAYYDPGYYWPGDELGSPGSYTPAGWRPGYDAAGVLRGYRVYAYPSGRPTYFTNHSFEYVLGDSYQEATHTAQSFSTNGQPPPQPGSNERLYNVNGELVSYFDPADVSGANNRIFATNASGQVLTAIAVTTPYSQYNSGLFSLSLEHTSSTPYAMPATQFYRYANGQYIGTFGTLQAGSFAANFNTTFEPISSYYPAPAPAQVTIQAGETLRSIATRVFGDGALWYVLADANGLTIGPDDSLSDKVGWSLRVPNEVVSMTNNAGTFKPFAAADALGDTTPIQPAPPPPKSGKGCGIVGQILIIVVAIVATVLTAGALAGAAGSGLGTMFAAGSSVLAGGATVAGVTVVGSAGAFFTAAAIAGAVGSAISQGFAMAIGMQDSFSWEGVALSAAGAGISSAMGASSFLSGTSLSPTQAMMVNAATSNALNQGIGILVGAQDKFNWRNVAMAAMSAPIVKTAGQGVQKLGTFVTDVTESITGSLVRAAFGGKIDQKQVLVDAFGNALGNSIVEALTPSAVTPQETKPKPPMIGDKKREPILPDSEEVVQLADLDPRDELDGDGYAIDQGAYFPAEKRDEFRAKFAEKVGTFHEASDALTKALADADNRGFFEKLLDYVQDTDTEREIDFRRRTVEAEYKEALRLGAIVAIFDSGQDRIPWVLTESNAKIWADQIPVESSLLDNAKELKASVQEFKKRVGSAASMSADVRRASGFVKAVGGNSTAAALATFINKFSKGMAQKLGKVSGVAGKVAKPLDLIDRGLKLEKDVEHVVNVESPISNKDLEMVDDGDIGAPVTERLRLRNNIEIGQERLDRAVDWFDDWAMGRKDDLVDGKGRTRELIDTAQGQ
ncbi:DUF6531 domain-containing protein [Steroidobacter flavus]|uniref:DUF6531 domain-containing protein n=1 Tax=Steroidobacter flavus TaxID=1842136 RepID=A0ABV8T0I6_9GAMM